MRRLSTTGAFQGVLGGCGIFVATSAPLQEAALHNTCTASAGLSPSLAGSAASACTHSTAAGGPAGCEPCEFQRPPMMGSSSLQPAGASNCRVFTPFFGCRRALPPSSFARTISKSTCGLLEAPLLAEQAHMYTERVEASAGQQDGLHLCRSAVHAPPAAPGTDVHNHSGPPLPSNAVLGLLRCLVSQARARSPLLDLL